MAAHESPDFALASGIVNSVVLGCCGWSWGVGWAGGCLLWRVVFAIPGKVRKLHLCVSALYSMVYVEIGEILVRASGWPMVAFWGLGCGVVAGFWALTINKGNFASFKKG